MALVSMLPYCVTWTISALPQRTLTSKGERNLSAKRWQVLLSLHFADMFGIISKLSLKMQRNDLILPVAVSLLHETVTNFQVLKSRPAPNDHLQRFMNILEKSKGEMQFQGITLKGTLDGTPKRGGARPDNFQSSVTEAGLVRCLPQPPMPNLWPPVPPKLSKICLFSISTLGPQARKIW